MANVNLKNLARMTVSSSGTGTVTLNAAVSGFLTFDLAGCSTAAAGSVVRYAISDTTKSEFAYGTYTSSSLTLTRGSSTTGLKSTNSDSPIDMSTAAQVFITDSYADHPWVVDTTGSPVTMTLSQDAATRAIVTNTSTGASASAGLVANSDAGSLNLLANGSGAGSLGALQWTGSGALIIDAFNAAGSLLIRTGAAPTTAITVSSTQGVALTGTLGVTGGTTLSGALTYGGVTLSNAVTGTGNMALSASPTFTGTVTIPTLALTTVGAHTISGAITYGGVALNNAVTGTGNMVLSASPTFTGTITAAAGTFSSTLSATTVSATSGAFYASGWGADANQGVIFLNAATTRYLHYNGTTYSMPGAGLALGADLSCTSIVCTTINTQNNTITAGGITCTTINTQSNTITAGVVDSSLFTGPASGTGAYIQAGGSANKISFGFSNPTLTLYVDDNPIKTFVIPHPSPEKNDTHYLVHSCLEGPEAAVFYRGKGVIGANGSVKILLPSYFTALCSEESATVQITPILGPNNMMPTLRCATEVMDGAFQVLGHPRSYFHWRVEAARRDVDPLVVEPKRYEITVHGDGPYRYYSRNE